MKKIIKDTQEPLPLQEYKLMKEASNQRAETNPDIPFIKDDYYTFQGSYPQYFDPFREHILKEQGFICCYCMQRIGFEEHERKMKFDSLILKVEHYKPKGKPEYAHLQLDYYNLLGACLGDPAEIIGKKRQLKKPYTHCDTIKLEEELKYIPNPSGEYFDSFEEGIAYQIVGEEILILHKDSLCSEELYKDKKKKRHLNLNEQNLVRDRYDVWFALCFEENQDEEITSWEITLEKKEALIDKYTSSYSLDIEVVGRSDNYTEIKTYEVYYPFCQMIVSLLKDIVH